ncbi:MAG TPA: 2-hydroxychromene-2-carboxylate isomerase [Kofleriaceae bacterium]|nr:2-hydroxychromene-2-carboxylate isomerase [Kofleriaceae bacterium]
MRLEYYFDFSCPFAYLGSIEVEAVARRTGAELVWRPMLLGGVLRAVGAEQTLAAEPAARRKDHLVDMRRWSEVRDLALVMPPGHPQRTVRALRTIVAVEERRWPAIIHDLYAAYWERGEPLEDTATLRRALNAAGVTASAAEQALAAADTQPCKDELRRRTDEAVARGVFGAPTLFVHGSNGAGEQMFWGQDRLEMAEAALRGWHPGKNAPPAGSLLSGLPQGAAAVGDASPVIQFWYDFSSPWSYLASTQIVALAARTGARIDWRPMLLGAVFKDIGSPNVPLFAMSESKRRYIGRDLEAWASAWQVPFRWNRHFPMKTVTALRLAILAKGRVAELSLALFRAAWGEDRNIDDPAELADLLTGHGFDAEAMLAGTREPEAKQRLIDATAEAVKRGVFGAPTFLVARGGDERLFWGQDRMGLVERAALGVTPPST